MLQGLFQVGDPLPADPPSQSVAEVGADERPPLRASRWVEALQRPPVTGDRVLQVLGRAACRPAAQHIPELRLRFGPGQRAALGGNELGRQLGVGVRQLHVCSPGASYPVPQRPGTVQQNAHAVHRVVVAERFQGYAEAGKGSLEVL